jgi:hypothetical protein
VTPVARRLAGDLASGVIPAKLTDELEMPYPLHSTLQLKLSQTILPTPER